jgi:hypothetical protein
MPPVRPIRGRRRTLGAAAALALVALIASCGNDSSSGLSQQRASALRSSLDRIDQRVSSRDCTGAAEQVSAFRRDVDALPSRVDRDLRDALDRSAARLETLVTDQCKPATPAPAEPAPTEEAPTGTTDQQDQDKKDKKAKKPKKPKDEQTPPETGGSGPTGSTGLTGPEGTTLPPEGG